jgi:hypothetical protein
MAPLTIRSLAADHCDSASNINKTSERHHCHNPAFSLPFSSYHITTMALSSLLCSPGEYLYQLQRSSDNISRRCAILRPHHYHHGASRCTGHNDSVATSVSASSARLSIVVDMEHAGSSLPDNEDRASMWLPTVLQSLPTLRDPNHRIRNSKLEQPKCASRDRTELQVWFRRSLARRQTRNMTGMCAERYAHWAR